MNSILENQTFDCVIKALRLGRHARLPNWLELEEIFLQKGENEFIGFFLDAEEGYYEEWTPKSKDLLRQDWVILL